MRKKELELICEMAAYHCVSIALLTEADQMGKPMGEVEAEAKQAFEALLTALHRAGFLDQLPKVFPERTRAPAVSKH